MSKFYIVDSTKSVGGKNPVVFFDTIPDVISYLGGMCQRNFGQTRKQFMRSVEELGFGADDAQGRNFFDQMSQYFNAGVLRGDSVPVKCDIFDADRFSKVKSVHGD